VVQHKERLRFEVLSALTTVSKSLLDYGAVQYGR